MSCLYNVTNLWQKNLSKALTLISNPFIWDSVESENENLK